MSQIHRRGFLTATATAGAAAYLGSTLRADDTAASDKVPLPARVKLGKTGIETTRLAMGTGVHGGNRQSDQTRMGFEKLVPLFRHAYDRGVRFFDLADLYGTHIYFREAFNFVTNKKLEREDFTILTKLWWRYDGDEKKPVDPYRRNTALSTLERFRHELQTDYIDIVLLHCMTIEKWDKYLEPYMDALTEAKEKKLIRAVGVSCHDRGALEEAAKCPWVDVVLARINLQGGPKVMMDGTTEEIVQTIGRIKKAGKTVIGMKIFGEGRLKDRKEECIKFAQGLGLLDAMTIGFHEPKQIDEVLTLLDKYPAAKVTTG
jgi:aryl-alcohol dehydrogenase-like predicted oxidoreductase